MQNDQPTLESTHEMPNAKPTKNKILLIISVVSGVIIATLLVLMIILPATNDAPQENSDSVDIDALLKDEEFTPSIAITELDFVLEEKGADEYIEQFQKAIDMTNDAETKAEYYLARADELYNYDLSKENNFLHQTQILSDAKAAEEIAPSVDSAQALYTYTEAFGDSDLATYYENLFNKRSTEDADATN